MNEWINCNFVYKSENYNDIYDNLIDELEKIYKPIFSNLEKEKYGISQDELEESLSNKDANTDEIIEKIDEINKWLMLRPEHAEYMYKYNNLKSKAASSCNDFYHSEINRPGTLIQLESGKVMLIGDINTAGGVCNDCAGIDDDDKIIKYSILFEKQIIIK